MPFYEYECPACKFYTEVLQKISDKPLRKCPSCGKTGFKRLVSAPVFRLKGSGWYETDFKSDKEGQRNLAGAEREEAPAADAKPKAEDKVAAKPGAEATSTKSEPAPKTDKHKPSAARSVPAKPGRTGAKPAAKPAARRGAKRPARSASRGRGRR
ncbi:MAG: zinc ribbon domain-containing protein [Proteobacteria bacterium]|nr:zinc ribbon domain-containing protein [Pseudomonadota bacterium]